MASGESLVLYYHNANELMGVFGFRKGQLISSRDHEKADDGELLWMTGKCKKVEV